MTLPAQDIVERLRYVTSEEVISTAANHDIHEAADTISRLTADNEALRAEIERMTPKFVAYEYLEAPDRREAAEALADALAQTLADAERRIVGLYDGIAPQAHYENELGINGHRTGNRYADNDEIVQRIRAALANEEAGG